MAVYRPRSRRRIKSYLFYISFITVTYVFLSFYANVNTVQQSLCMDDKTNLLLHQQHKQQQQLNLQVGKSSFTYCVIQITSKQGAIDRKDANFRLPSSSSSTAESSSQAHQYARGQYHLYINKYDSIVGTLNFDALESAFLGPNSSCTLETVQWVFLGDDDTLFYDGGIQTFMKRRTKQVQLLFVHGNFFNPRHSYQKGWFTGGSGIALSAKTVHKLLDYMVNNKTDYEESIQKEYSYCHCGDVPFARIMQQDGFRVRFIYQPNLFLDSCLDCAATSHGKDDVLVVDGLDDIVSCHGATMFRNVNTHANDKIAKMKDTYSNYFVETHKLRHYGDYKQPTFFVNMTLQERRLYFDKSCTTTRITL